MDRVLVVGLGYVGLPLAREACQAGLTVSGLDTNRGVVEGLNAGSSHVDDLSDSDVAFMVEQGFTASTEAASAANADVVVICVPTPLGDDGGPDLSSLRAAARAVAPHLRPDSLVVLESTSYPGTTAEFLGPLLESGSHLRANIDFHLAFSPERIDPGNRSYNFRNTPKVVGADSPAAQARAFSFYSQIVDEVVEAKGTREAEAAKLLENTYRHVNIALVNEMARFFHEFGIDFWDVIQLAESKPFGFQAFRPGPGVGGHCIPIDPNYLSHRVRSQLGYAFRFVELAQEINNSMPAYVVHRATLLLNSAGKSVKDSSILLLGVTYKANIADVRESPATQVALGLLRLGARVSYLDPHVHSWLEEVGKVESSDDIKSADLVVLLQDHKEYDIDQVEEAAALMLDTRGVSSGGRTERL